MYLPSKFIKPKLAVSLLLLIVIAVYFTSAPLFRNAFVYFYSNLIVSRTKLSKEINLLKAKNIKLMLENKKFNSLRKENEKLKKLLNFQKQHNIKVVPLNVISMVPSYFRRAVVVNGGKNIGIKKNTFILDENAFLLGKVSRVYYDYSEISLINDPDFYTTVKINGNLGLLKGTLSGKLKVFYINNGSNIKANDKVSALSYNTHSKFTVGIVEKARDSIGGFFMDITVKPFSKLYFYKTVFAIR